jgi:2-polyprenyl-3-methyl-5-hydroxy-6-metoxy-1,4-benzoquinol methylase
MIHALQLAGKVVLRKLPSRALWWGIANKFNYFLRTGNRRYEFELLYLEHPDPWNYRCNPDEHSKYNHALACVLKWRKASGCVLEIGCSIGVFSKMLAAHFNEVTAIDVSTEALRAAAFYNLSNNNIQFVRGDLRWATHDRQYDAIICAEILYYIPEKHAERVCQQLDKCLAPDGVIVTVSGIGKDEPNFFYFNGWDQILGHQFAEVCTETVAGGARPYEIVVFSRSTQPFVAHPAAPAIEGTMAWKV